MTPVWDSPGGYGLEHFLPPCVCGHPVESHKWYPTGKPRRKCLTGTPNECPCREYTAGDPANWPPVAPTQGELPL
jgi:hypothetical protein